MQGNFQIYQLGSQVLQCSQEIISQEEKAFDYSGDNLRHCSSSLPNLAQRQKYPVKVITMKLVPGNRAPGSFTANSSPEVGTPLQKVKSHHERN